MSRSWLFNLDKNSPCLYKFYSLPKTITTKSSVVLNLVSLNFKFELNL